MLVVTILGMLIESLHHFKQQTWRRFLLSTMMHLVKQNGVETFGKKRPTGLNVDLSINEMKVCTRECC